MTLANQGYCPVPLTPVTSGRDILTDLERANRPPVIQLAPIPAYTKPKKKRETKPKPRERKDKPRRHEQLRRDHGAAILADYNAGKSLFQLAREHHTDIATIRHVVTALGVTLRNDIGRHSPKADQYVPYKTLANAHGDALKAAYEAGASRYKLGLTYGAHYSTVTNALRWLGVEIRNDQRLAVDIAPQQVAEVVARTSYRRAATELGISETTVKRMMRKAREAGAK